MRIQLLRAVAVVIALCMSQTVVAEEAAPSVEDNFKLGGYLSAGLNAHPGGKTDGALNEVGLILGWENDSRFRFLSELDVERPLTLNENGTGSGINTHLGMNRLYLERIYVDYNLSDKLNLRAGRFLTPAGRWNLGHAAPLVWTTSRPLATGNQLFPVGTNGLMLYGALPLKDSENEALEYNFFVGLSKDQHTDKKDILYDDIKGARFVLSGKVSWGLSLLEFRESSLNSPYIRMLGVDFLVQHDDWEWSGEATQRYYSNDADGGSGAYLQGVAPIVNQWFAVARVETFKSPVTGSSERLVLGTAWRMRPGRVLKLEYVAGDNERPESPKGLLASFAILF